MSSLKTILFGGLFAGLVTSTAMACATSPVVDDEETPGAATDASTPTKDGAPASSTARDSAPPPPVDGSPPPPVDAGSDALVGVDSAPPVDASTDGSTGGTPPFCDPGDSSILGKAILQQALNDTPPCDAACRGCCYIVGLFCVK